MEMMIWAQLNDIHIIQVEINDSVDIETEIDYVKSDIQSKLIELHKGERFFQCLKMESFVFLIEQFAIEDIMEHQWIVLNDCVTAINDHIQLHVLRIIRMTMENVDRMEVQEAIQ